MDSKAEFDNVFKQYQRSNIVFTDADIENISYRYVYFSNKLEGNRLNLAQTTTLLKSNIAQGDLPIRDYLEAKGHYKALKFIISAALNKYPLDDRVLKQANKLTLEPYWSLEDAYPNSKAKNQLVGEYKVTQNKITWDYNKRKGEILPLSNPHTVEKNINKVMDMFNQSKSHLIEKTAFLAYQIFIHQPFHDANKRTSRLMTTFVSMKEGLPITAFDYQEKFSNFNHALITSYLEDDKSIMEEFLAKEFIASMGQLIEHQKTLDNSKNKGLSFFI